MEKTAETGCFHRKLSVDHFPLICDLAGIYRSSGQVHEPHPVSTVEMVLDGNMYADYRGGVHCIGPGDVIFLAAGENHRLTPASGTFQKAFVSVSGAEAQNLVHILFKGQYVFHPGEAVGKRIRDDMAEIIRLLRRDRAPEEISSVLFRILISLNMTLNAGADEDKMGEILKFMESHVSFRLSECSPAEALHISRSHLTGLFRRHFQMTPSAYFLRMRMKKSLDLLKNSSLTVKEIASAVGYASGLTFSREFKKYYGANPSDFRKLGQ